MPQNLNHQVSLDREYQEGHIKMRTTFLRTRHKHVSINEHSQRRQQTRLHIVTLTFSDSQKHDQSAVQDPVYALINFLYTQTFAEDQIEDTREHAKLQKVPPSWPVPLSMEQRSY